MKNFLKDFLLVLLLIVVLVPNGTVSASRITVKALSYENRSAGIDLFILIDQSDSMRFNDPQNLRIDTAKYLLDFMTFYSLSQSDSVNRISVIGFGSKSKSKVMVPLMIVPATNLAEKDYRIDDAKQKIESENLGKTNVVSAFELAQQQLQMSEELGKDRQHIIVLITDGVPLDDSEGGSILQQFDSIGQKYDEMKNNFGRWDLLVIGIDDQDSFWTNDAAPEWNKIATTAIRVQRAEEIKSEVVKEMGALLGYGNQIFSADEPIQVEPYSELVQFSVFKYEETPISLIFQKENGGQETVIPDLVDIFRLPSSGYELWVIKNPVPGTWIFKAGSDSRLDIFKQNKFLAANITQPEKDIPFKFPFFFEFAIPDLTNDNLDFPLHWQATLTKPDGQVSEIKFISSSDLSTFRSEQYYQPEQIGVYSLKIEGLIKINPATPDVKVIDQEYSFTVGKLKAVLLNPLDTVPLMSSLNSVDNGILNQNDEPYKGLDDNNLRLNVLVIPITQASPIEKPMTYDANRKLFSASFLELPTSVEGAVDVQLSGDYKINGDIVKVLDEELHYDVSSSLPYYTIISPQPDIQGRYPLFDGFIKKDFEIRIQWKQNNEPVDPADIFINKPEDLVLVDIQGPDVNLIDLPLQVLSEEDTSTFGLTLPNLAKAGEYQATFKFQPAMLVASKQLYMEFAPQTIKFTRVEGGLLPWVQLIAWLIAIGLLLWLLLLSYNYLVPPFPKGIITIKEQNNLQRPASFAEINLSSRIGKKMVWRNNPKLQTIGIYRMVISHIPGKTKSQGGGVRVSVFGAKNKCLYQLIFNRGMVEEKPLPGSSKVGNSRYLIRYEPPNNFPANNNHK